jgi:hypothetical protein
MTEKRQTSQGYIIRILQHFATKLWNITNFVMLFQAVMKFCLDLLRSKFSLLRKWSIEMNSEFKISRFRCTGTGSMISVSNIFVDVCTFTRN